MQLWAHVLVKNEERYLWFAVSSVINFVDKVLLWDTGSTDSTLIIIEELIKRYPSKISFKEVGEVNLDGFTIVRQKMLEKSNCDWILIVDGDEVWWDEKIRELREIIETKGQKLDSIVSRYYNIVGDIYHYQDESFGRYSIDDKVGNLTIRAFNRHIKGLKFVRPHGQQGLVDYKGVLIQERNPQKRFWTKDYSYLHFTFMARSSSKKEDLKVPKRKIKIKYELGKSFPRDFYYPEVFFRPKPAIVKNIWENANWCYIFKGAVETPLKKIKRMVFPFAKSGY